MYHAGCYTRWEKEYGFVTGSGNARKVIIDIPISFDFDSGA